MDTFFKGNGEPSKAAAWRDLQTPLRGHNAVTRYKADPGLVSAVNVALTLGQPLLLTGEPGTGKTQLARVVAAELDIEMEIFETKSSSTARDLLYSYDALARFHAAQDNSTSINPMDYISYQAIGKAILQAMEPEAAQSFVVADRLHPAPVRTLVLIDEIDKAPRDLPNDLLSEIEQMSFVVPELGGTARIEAPKELRPIVIITSNSEKSLPDAFLRRCIFYHIPFPDKARLAEIVDAQFEFAPEAQLVQDAISIFEQFRTDNPRKRPGTAELLEFITVLGSLGIDANATLKNEIAHLHTAAPTLVKVVEDRDKFEQAIERWAGTGR